MARCARCGTVFRLTRDRLWEVVPRWTLTWLLVVLELRASVITAICSEC
jgi:hypothetical protein